MSAPARVLDPRHGTHDPTQGTPARAPASVRRTTTVDMLRPDGVLGQLVLLGRGRDLATGADGSATVLAEATTGIRVAFLDGRRITAVSSGPARGRLVGLVGATAGSGFRNKVDELVPEERDARSLLYQLLDDVPVATLVSGYALQAADAIPAPAPAERRPGTPDLCAGWRSGGTIMLDIGRTGLPPTVTGPPAPRQVPTDEDGWHALPDLPAHGMRRARRLDVRLFGGDVLVDSLFRDSHVSEDGLETVIHEYEVRAVVDPATWRVRSAGATPRVLPWFECPSAADSAQRLAGVALAGLRTDVRRDFTGTSTCTHLNDQLRTLADVEVLAAPLL